MASSPSPHYDSEDHACSGVAASLGLIAVGAAGFVAGLIWAWRSLAPRASAYPQSLKAPLFESPTLPLPPPKELTAETIDEFVQWVAAVPKSDTQRIREAVARARGNDAVHLALIGRLFSLPVVDFGVHQLLLSILGELRRPDSAEHLIRFVNLPGNRVIPPTSPPAGRWLVHFVSRLLRRPAGTRRRDARLSRNLPGSRGRSTRRLRAPIACRSLSRARCVPF